MNTIPAKVYVVLGAEAGLFVGLGIILYHTARIVAEATKQHSWAGFRSL